MAKRKFQDTVRAHLEKRKWGQAELATRAGLSPALVSKVLSESRDLTISNVLAIARALNVAAAVLVEGDPVAEELLAEVVPRADYEKAERDRIDAVIAHDAAKAEMAAIREQLVIAQRHAEALTKERIGDRRALDRAVIAEARLVEAEQQLTAASQEIVHLQRRVAAATTSAASATNNWKVCEQARSETHAVLSQAHKELRDLKAVAGVGAVLGLLAIASKK